MLSNHAVNNQFLCVPHTRLSYCTVYILVSPGYIVEDWIASFTCASLVEDIQCLERFKLILFMHVVLRHQLFKFRTCQVHTTPPGDTKIIYIYFFLFVGNWYYIQRHKSNSLLNVLRSKLPDIKVLWGCLL